MWEINNSLQLLSFARSVGLGCILSLIYDCFRIFRKLFGSSAVSVFLQDVFYAAFSAFLTFLFLLSVTNGEVRAFVLFGLAIGFVAARLTVSKLIYRFFVFSGSRIMRRISAVFSYIYGKFDLIEQNTVKFFENIRKTLKKLLKTQVDLLYTKKNKKREDRPYETQG